MKNQIKACMIDLDGTLVDTIGDFEKALKAMLAEQNLAPLTQEQIKNMVGRGSHHLIKTALIHQGINESQITPDYLEKAYQTYEKKYQQINGQYSSTYSQIPEALEKLKNAGLTLICLTNKPKKLAEQLLAAKQLEKYFSHTVGGDSYPEKKPNPMPLIKTCEKLNIKPENAVMIGDSQNDLQAARGANITAILIKGGYTGGQDIKELTKNTKDKHFDTLLQAADWITN